MNTTLHILHKLHVTIYGLFEACDWIEDTIKGLERQKDKHISQEEGTQTGD